MNSKKSGDISYQRSDQQQNDNQSEINNLQSSQNTENLGSINNVASDIEAPLSPILTNSRNSSRHIARRKSRRKLLNKFSQNSNLGSQESYTSLQSQTPTFLNAKDETLSKNNLSTVLEIVVPNSKPETSVSVLEKDNSLEERMKRILEIQRSKKFDYNIAQRSSKVGCSTTDTENNCPQNNILNIGIAESFVVNKNINEDEKTDFNFKVPESPVSLAKIKKNELLNTDTVATNVDTNIGFQTGSGKKINLSERLLKRAAKIFDDIVDIPEPTDNSIDICRPTDNFIDISRPKDNFIDILGPKNSVIDISRPTDNVINKKSYKQKIETSFDKNKYNGSSSFKTASGSTLTLSGKSVLKAKSLFNDIYDLSNYTEVENKENVSKDSISDLELSNSFTSSIQNLFSDSFEAENDIPRILNQEIATKDLTENKSIYKVSENMSDKDLLSQITDTQMCLVAENAEYVADFTQWTSSPNEKSPKTQFKDDFNKIQKDIDEFTSPETEKFFGNLTFREDGTVASRNSPNKSDTGHDLKNDVDKNKLVDKFKECDELEVNNKICQDENKAITETYFSTENDENSSECFGFTWDETLKSLKILELYKRSFKYVEKDIKNNIFYPLGFTFSDIQSSKEYQNKNYKYSLRPKRKSATTTYYNNQKKSKVSRKKTSSISSKESKNKLFDNTLIPPAVGDPLETKLRSNVEENSNICCDIDTQTKNDSQKVIGENIDENNSDIKRIIGNLEDAFISSVENSSKNSNNAISVKEYHKYREEDNIDYQNEASKLKSDQKNDILEKMRETFNEQPTEIKYETICCSTKKQYKLDEFNHSENCNEIKDEFQDKENIANNTLKYNKKSASSKLLDKTMLVNKSSFIRNTDIVEEEFNSNANNNIGFSTASGKKLNVSSESLIEARNLFQGSDFENVYFLTANSQNNKNLEKQSEQNDPSLEFATGSAKKISISDESLKKAKTVIENCERIEILSENKISPGCILNKVAETSDNTASFGSASKTLSESEDSLKIGNNVYKEIIETNRSYSKNITSCGFATASGKGICLSEIALQKAKNIFKDCSEYTFDENVKTTKNITSFGFATASGKNVSVSEMSLQKAKNIFNECSNEDTDDENKETAKNLTSFGFATASGKKVPVSEMSLQKAKNIFKECSHEDTDSENKEIRNITSLGFATASGKKVPVSEISLQKAKNIFKDYSDEDKNVDSSKDLSYLSSETTSEKNIPVSEISSQELRHMFKDYSDKEFIHKNVDICENTTSFGFATASGNKISVSVESLQKAKHVFQDCANKDELDINVQTSSNNEQLECTTASENELSGIGRLQNPKNIFEDTSTSISSLGFATASGKNVSISEESLKKAKNIFQEENIEKNIELSETSMLEFATATGKEVTILDKAKTVQDNQETSKNISFGFATASGNNVAISEEAVNKAKTLLNECNDFDSENSQLDCEIHSTSKDFTEEIDVSKKVKSSINISGNHEENVLNTPKNKIMKEDINYNLCQNKNESSVSSKKYISPKISTPVSGTKISSVRSSKKRSLGVSSCRQIDIAENNLKRAKLVFDDVDTPKKRNTINNNNSTFLPVVSTPRNIKSAPALQSKSLLNSSVTMKETNQLKLSEKITPPPKKICLGDEIVQKSSLFVFQERTEGDSTKWNANLQKELEMLKVKMSVVETRMCMLNKQQEIIQSGSSDHRRQRPGRLFSIKSKSESRISLKEAVNNRRPGKNTQQICLNIGLDPSILEITPDNSSALHLHAPWWTNDNRTYPAVIRTEDGAVVIPNQHDFVGISEIEQAFLAMPGVDPTLVPKKWISNHYRWIVWKLASMERNFPDIFKDYLQIDSVVAQLKYRYDREIDREQRPALRKIIECDDTAAKRMVLCVATIIKIAENKYELELTDGWYSIKTILDAPLNSLVEKNLIKVGTKLMIQGAELVNCEGCSPLELPSNVRLQIHFNSTRRAAWHLKLGYQPIPGPLRISLRMIASNGGPVGGVRAYVARIYPISFMERSNAGIMWRNQRAEMRRANQWEAAYSNQMENLQMQVQQELEKEWEEKKKTDNNKKFKIKDLKDVYCGETLYQMLEKSCDPDSVKELLTSSQIAALQDYQSKLNTERQSELTSRLRERISDANLQPRNVSSVLKVLLVDVLSIFHFRTLNIWRPNETHTQFLKEDTVINIYNISAKNNGILSSVPRTQFDEDLDFDTQKFENLNRFVLPISQTANSELKTFFGEFDTIGMVVVVDVQEIPQILWMVDENYRFLLVKIREGPETCILFDGVTPGKVLSLTNLIHQKPFKRYGEAFANTYTFLTSYPQQKYLQEFLKDFIDSLPQDVEKYLEECKNLVKEFSASSLKRSIHSNPLDIDISEEETEILMKKLCGLDGTQNKSESLTLSDEEIALIDTQVM